MRKVFLFILLFLAEVVIAQEKTVLSAFKQGTVQGHVRNYFMYTSNRYGKDYFADALGAKLEYETDTFKGFQLGVSGIFTYKLFSSDLNDPDAETGKSSKWEHELFDVLHPDNFEDIDRLEALYIKYHFNDSNYVSFGKTPIEYTPLLNESDGRMKPFAFQGIWFNGNKESWQYDAAWIYKVSPRSTTAWYKMDEAIGLTDNGYQPNGIKADYADKLSTAGLGILYVGKKQGAWEWQLWNMYLDKIMHTGWFQLEYNKYNWKWGAIWSYQIPHGYQKKLDYDSRYIQPDENGNVLSIEAIYKSDNSTWKAAYTHAFDNGRYLFPRELGRDRFYTSMPRSRLEGLGDVDVFTAGYMFKKKQLEVHVDATITNGIRLDDHQFNKYNLDDYTQVNTKLHYAFDGYLNGLSIDFMYIWKYNMHNHAPVWVYQKSDYNQLNLIANFKF
jgi:hypothetical protein